MSQLDLSIIIVSFNTKDLLINCIESIAKHTKHLKYEIVVVDNGSSDESVKSVLELSKKILRHSKITIKVIENSKNIGFGQATNQGIKKASGNYVLLLNSDTIIKDNLLGEMVLWMNKMPKAGIASCALKNSDDSMQATGGYFPSLARVFAWMLFLDDLPLVGKLIKPFHPHTPDFFGNNPSFLKKHEQDWVTGAFMLIKKQLFEEVGYFDKDYFMYTEEVDFCFRVKHAGWQVWYLPKWKVVHLGGASGTREGALLGEYRGVKTFYRKHFPGWQYPVLRLLLKLGALGRIALFGILEGPSAGKIYAKAFKQA